MHRVADGNPRDPLTHDEDKAFGETILSVLGNKLVHAYLQIRNGKDCGSALDARFNIAILTIKCCNLILRP
jgi:hypothetical protein